MELPVGFYSSQLKDAETRYATTELECLAIVEAVRHFDHVPSLESTSDQVGSLLTGIQDSVPTRPDERQRRFDTTMVQTRTSALKRREEMSGP